MKKKTKKISKTYIRVLTTFITQNMKENIFFYLLHKKFNMLKTFIVDNAENFTSKTSFFSS